MTQLQARSHASAHMADVPSGSSSISVALCAQTNMTIRLGLGED